MENHKNEFTFSKHSIIAYVWRGILVGIIAGAIVSLFRLLIEMISEKVIDYYHQAHSNLMLLVPIAGFSILAVFLVGLLVKSDANIKGSGIPHVEGELKGLMSPNWWSVLWKKYLGGTIAISMGLMLGREGPSIQLGAMSAKGLAKYLESSRLEKRVLIASGAAAGLSAAFNAPIAGLLFVVEEIYHHFSRLVWITALVASLVANFISLNIFGLRPVLAMPKAMPFLALNQYWLLLILGLVLGCLGFLYEEVILHFHRVYDFLGKSLRLAPHFHGLIVVAIILPIGYYLPQLLGGGHGLIMSLSEQKLPLLTVLAYFFIRFLGSMFSYGSGLPGGIFLPILTLGALSGTIIGLIFQQMGLLDHQLIPLFLVLGMAGYFAAVSKAPLTGMILVTEMVGDLKPLMAIAVVTFVAYLVMDLLNGQPIYEAMLEKMAIEHPTDLVEPTLIELPVSEKIAGRYVRDLKLPKNVLITTQIHHKKSQVVSGDTLLISGATIFLVVNEADTGFVREVLM
ncbi:TPA: ClC family H(+)/Cl(-) exchange transporter [Streptococcus equi subsp. zooepidemicus]|nr:ClC family H(+)/Cl(-) exchange transporter [Streptococcus equi subsp. zooepidemicus]HEL0561657.1 ClC family H(+)/Cl(-) exchange transporter [Streptococcus equi subsp. zooepidemicus]